MDVNIYGWICSTFFLSILGNYLDTIETYEEKSWQRQQHLRQQTNATFLLKCKTRQNPRKRNQSKRNPKSIHSNAQNNCRLFVETLHTLFYYNCQIEKEKYLLLFLSKNWMLNIIKIYRVLKIHATPIFLLSWNIILLWYTKFCYILSIGLRRCADKRKEPIHLSDGSNIPFATRCVFVKSVLVWSRDSPIHIMYSCWQFLLIQCMLRTSTTCNIW